MAFDSPEAAPSKEDFRTALGLVLAICLAQDRLWSWNRAGDSHQGSWQDCRESAYLP